MYYIYSFFLRYISFSSYMYIGKEDPPHSLCPAIVQCLIDLQLSILSFLVTLATFAFVQHAWKKERSFQLLFDNLISWKMYLLGSSLLFFAFFVVCLCLLNITIGFLTVNDGSLVFLYLTHQLSFIFLNMEIFDFLIVI